MPLTYSEIESWSRLTQTNLTPYQAEQLHGLSRVYCNEFMKCNGNQPTPSPWFDPDYDRAAVSDSIRNAFKKIGVD